MARSKNIGELAYHNFRTGDDCLTVLYDRTKADQSGGKVMYKYVYANPVNPIVCPHLAPGFWFTLRKERGWVEILVYLAYKLHLMQLHQINTYHSLLYY